MRFKTLQWKLTVVILVIQFVSMSSVGVLYLIAYYLNFEPVVRLAKSPLMVPLVFFTVAMVLSALIAIPVTRFFLRPLKQLSEATLKVQKGDFITFDFGALYKGYHSDMTRTVAVGEVSEEMRQVYDTVLRANVACCQEMKAGCIGGDNHQLALDIISKEGYGEYFQHGLGHSVGLEIHEDPRASLNGTAKLECGNVLTVEPGIYLPGKFGVRIEDMIWLSPDGPKNLTNTPKELLIL